MGIQDLFKTNTYKNQVTQLQEENEYLKSLLSPEMQVANKLNDHLQMMRQNEEQLAASLSKLYESNKDQKKIAENLKADIAEREAKIQSLDSEILMQDFGLYQPRFDFANSTQYKDKLKECRNRQKAEIKAFNSQADSTQWTVNNSKAQGKKLVRQISRLLMRAYNSECDEIVRKVRTSNIQKSITAVYSMADTVNKQATVVGLQIPGHYQKLKEEEVRLAYEF
jgi:chromosome segregation ATPase